MISYTYIIFLEIHSYRKTQNLINTIIIAAIIFLYVERSHCLIYNNYYFHIFSLPELLSPIKTQDYSISYYHMLSPLSPLFFTSIKFFFHKNIASINIKKCVFIVGLDTQAQSEENQSKVKY